MVISVGDYKSVNGSGEMRQWHRTRGSEWEEHGKKERMKECSILKKGKD